MAFATWCLFIGGLLILMGLAGTLVRALPISAAALYMLIGYVAGPEGFGLLDLSLARDAYLIEVIAEIALLISLFAVGLRLQIRVFDATWMAPVLLATVAMTLTIAVMTVAGVIFELAFATALLLAAILAPTDPVLASEVRVKHEKDRDELRFGLTAEGGLNDGAAFPFVMLALGLLGARELGPMGLRWLGADVLWAIGGGLALGWLCGAGFTRLVMFLRQRKHQALGMESFLALGLIALTYGIALQASVYGFLAVFVAGLGMRDVESVVANDDPAGKDAASDVQTSDGAPTASAAGTAGKMTRLVLDFARELERFIELAAMLVIGSLLSRDMLTATNFSLAGVLICVARPLSVYLTTFAIHWTPMQRRLGAWFGIRGVGSLYYLAYAANHGAPASQLQALTDCVLLAVALSVLLHGSSATPLMASYQRLQRRK
ncbi:cation:proton antiporter [Variovorax paradoxus]|nr:cation:proton antiporter [Variovorax paradoxus]